MARCVDCGVLMKVNNTSMVDMPIAHIASIKRIINSKNGI